MRRQQKRIFAAALIFTFLFAVLFAAPALAYTEYGQIYDATDLFDSGRCRSLEQELADLSDREQVDLHVDVVDDLEGKSIDEYARVFYTQYGYGNETTGDGILLMVHLTEDEDSLAYQNFSIVYGGQNKEALRSVVEEIAGGVSPYLSEAAFAGDLEEDNDAFFHAVEAVISAAGGISEAEQAAQTAQTEAEIQPLAGAGSLETDVTPLDQVTSSSLDLGQIDGGFVLDSAGLLSSSEKADLEAKAAELAVKYGVGVYVLTVDNYRNYGGDSNIERWTEKLYMDNQLGLGDAQNGVILALSMAERDYCLKIYGQDALFAYTDYAQEQLTDRFLSSFRNNDWYGGFSRYMNFGETILEDAQDGSPMEKTVNMGGVIGGSGLLSAVAGLATGSGRVRRLRRTMKNTGIRRTARQYVSKEKGMRLLVNQDHYVNTSVSRTRIRHESDKSSGGGGGGGGTSVNSNGFSGGSGKF